MSAKVFSVSDLLKNLNKVSFSELKRQKSGYVSWVNYNQNGSLKRIYVKTPKMFAPFGATNYNPNNIPAMNNKFQVALSFKGEDENTNIADLKVKLLFNFFLFSDLSLTYKRTPNIIVIHPITFTFLKASIKLSFTKI